MLQQSAILDAGSNPGAWFLADMHAEFQELDEIVGQTVRDTAAWPPSSVPANIMHACPARSTTSSLSCPLSTRACVRAEPRARARR